MLRKLVKQLGIVKTSVLVTIVAVLFSIGLSVTIEFLLHGEVSSQVIVFAITMPILIAPIFNFLFLRMVFQLEDLQAKFRAVSITDELTQAFNRRHWIELAELELARAKRYGQVFSVIIFDLDDFKRVNDTHGHLAGDLVLRQVSRICLSASRKMDAFARYGGEEFIFLLPQSDKPHARLVAERIRQELAQARFSFNQTEIRITVSVGVVTFDQVTSDLEGLLMRVDKALYAAKKAGKNRSIVAEELTR
ncbi:putative diguanylate cyclase DgcC [Anaerolineae bacterium]|nr:putative diguanylate cyclase DgcC [Anaerolineae bacterium]